jgi:phosphatidylethanolamine/phosphatidyl-N-methylethanolamine N-methyltransferase
MKDPRLSPGVARSRFNTNKWNRARYTLWAPFYDLLVNVFHRRRQRALQVLNPQPGERILIVGAGTGMDLDFIPPGVLVTATDLTPAMLDRLKARAQKRGLTVEARVMDGQALEFEPQSFDAVVLHLILAVIPNPVRCAREAARVLHPGGRAIIFDKFLPDEGRASLMVRCLNPIAGLFGTEMTRKLGPILAGSGLRIVYDEAAGAGGYFRIILVRKDL